MRRDKMRWVGKEEVGVGGGTLCRDSGIQLLLNDRTNTD